jgi:hypothetical protein
MPLPVGCRIRVAVAVGLCLLTADASRVRAVPANPAPVNIILDSDIASNVDDVGDHALLWALAASGQVNVLALITSSTNPWSAPAVYAIAKYYGHPDVPIGAFQGAMPNSYATTNSYYTQQLTNRFGKPKDTRASYPPAVTVYRQALANAPNGSVIIIAGGFYGPLWQLLKSSPDAISPMSGMQLIAAKVLQLISAAGYFPNSGDSGSFNFASDATNASYVFQNWPGPVTSFGTEVGGDVLTGPAADADPTTNPMKLAYNLYCSNGEWCPNQQYAWTQVAILYAAQYSTQTTADFEFGGSNGSTVVRGSNAPVPGQNTWSQTPARQQSYVEKTVPAATLQSIIDSLIQSPPPRSPR